MIWVVPNTSFDLQFWSVMSTFFDDHEFPSTSDEKQWRFKVTIGSYGGVGLEFSATTVLLGIVGTALRRY